MPSPTSSSWSVYDLTFLRKLRIEAGMCPLPSPRFHVEMDGGDAILYDRALRKPWRFKADAFADPRAVAESVAQERNADGVEDDVL